MKYAVLISRTACVAVLLAAIPEIEVYKLANNVDLPRWGWTYSVPYILLVLGAISVLFKKKVGNWLLYAAAATYWLGHVWLYLPGFDVHIRDDHLRLQVTYLVNVLLVLIMTLPHYGSRILEKRKGTA